MVRKACAGCGSLNLQDESRCWACGDTRFMDDGSGNGSERTLAYNLGLDRTLFWSADRKLPPGTLYVGVGAGVALFMCVVGFWIGRASAPADAPPEVAAAPAEPVRLPVPPAELTPTYSYTPPVAAPSTAAPSAAAPGVGAVRSVVPQEDPVVTVRPRPQMPAASVQPPAHLAGVPGTPPPTVTYQVAAPRRPTANVTRTPTPGAEAGMFPAFAEPVAAARPAAGEALVVLRNEDNAPVDVVIDGNGTRTAIIAPGASVPLNLGVGSYQFRASGKGASSIRSTLALGANRTYRLVINRKDEAGREVLVLIEPAIDGHSG